jgi:HD-GYP domain-containing protein (c-di-GMP phosphodiesterase class II)
VISSFIDMSDRVRRERTRRTLLQVNQFVVSGIDDGDPLQYLFDTLGAYGPYALVGVAVTSSTNESGYDIVCGAADNDRLYEVMASSSGLKVSGLGSIGAALRTRVTQVVNDLRSHPSSMPLGELALQFGLGAVIAIPFAPGGSQEALAVFSRDVFSFDDATVLELETIAKEFKFGISHLRSVAELAASLEGTLGVLAEMTETRDPYAAGHQIHVGCLGEAIATHLGLDATAIRLVRQSGEVHDIGKTAIPSDILTRPSRLSALEFELVKTHATVGFTILSKASLPWPIAEVALLHHERLDGSGYPSGLLADEINLPARIIAVADVVEAMTHHRPYRPGLGVEAALAEVSQGAGVLYDAAVVDACLAVFKAGFSFDSRSDPRSERAAS